MLPVPQISFSKVREFRDNAYVRVFVPQINSIEVKEHCFLYSDLEAFILAQNVPQVFPAYANYFDFSSNSVTDIDDADVWYKLNTDTVFGFSRNGLVHANNRLTYTGDSEKIFQAEGIISLSSGNNNSIRAAFFKNGDLWPCSEQDVVTDAGGRLTAVPFHCLINLSNGDYIEVWVKNVNTTNDITIDNINVILTEK
jgi:hypothetical protein